MVWLISHYQLLLLALSSIFVGWAWASPRKAIHFVCNCRHCGSLRIDRVEQGNGLGGGGAVEVAALRSVMLAFVYPIGCRLSLSSLSHRSHIDICEHSNACLFRQNQQASQLQLRLHSAIRKTCSRIVNVAVIDRETSSYLQQSQSLLSTCVWSLTACTDWLSYQHGQLLLVSLHLRLILVHFLFSSVLFSEPGFPYYRIGDHQSHGRRATLCTWWSLP